MELYKIEELKKLKVGDEVYVKYKHYEHGKFEEVTKVLEVSDEDIYFENGYDFPFYETPNVETEFAIEDDGDFTFKVFKL